MGDFCYVEPGTVRFHLKLLKLKPDFQLKEDGTLTKRYFGVRNQLVFQFIRSDGQYLTTVEQCPAFVSQLICDTTVSGYNVIHVCVTMLYSLYVLSAGQVLLL